MLFETNSHLATICLWLQFNEVIQSARIPNKNKSASVSQQTEHLENNFICLIIVFKVWLFIGTYLIKELSYLAKK